MMKKMRIVPKDITPGTYLYVIDPTPYSAVPSGVWVRVDSLVTREGYATVTFNKKQHRLDVAWSCRLPSDLERLAAVAAE